MSTIHTECKILEDNSYGLYYHPAKKFVVVQPEEHPAVYKSVISHVEVPLPGNALRMTAMPNAVEGKGIWAASGVNAANVGMTATETITSNPRVLGADPLVVYQPAGTASRKSPAASAKRILFTSSCPTSILPARACSVWASCWKSTAPMR